LQKCRGRLRMTGEKLPAGFCHPDGRLARIVTVDRVLRFPG
jgi:hypothetical protein